MFKGGNGSALAPTMKPSLEVEAVGFELPLASFGFPACHSGKTAAEKAKRRSVEAAATRGTCRLG